MAPEPGQGGPGEYPEDVAQAIAGLRRPGYPFQRAAARRLEQMGRRALPAVLELLGDPDRDLRWWALEVLGHLADPEAVPPLVRALEDPHADVRLNAAWALACIAERSPTPCLAPAVPVLRGYLTRDRCLGEVTRRQYRDALEKIQRVTGGVSDLPLPADPPSPAADSLPRPAGAPAPEAVTLPLPSEAAAKEP